METDIRVAIGLRVSAALCNIHQCPCGRSQRPTWSLLQAE